MFEAIEENTGKIVKGYLIKSTNMGCYVILKEYKIDWIFRLIMSKFTYCKRCCKIQLFTNSKCSICKK